MEKLKKELQEYYKREFKELQLLDELMLLETDYSNYREQIEKKTDQLIEKIENRGIQYLFARKAITDLTLIEYRDLNEDEKQVINDEVNYYLTTIINEITENH